MPYLIDGHNLIPKLIGFSLRAMDDEEQLIPLLQTFSRVRARLSRCFSMAPRPAFRDATLWHPDRPLCPSGAHGR
jgi:hypothetical protein